MQTLLLILTAMFVSVSYFNYNALTLVNRNAVPPVCGTWIGASVGASAPSVPSVGMSHDLRSEPW